MTGDYLWDRTGWPDPEVVRLERVLGTLGFAPDRAEAYRPAPAPRLTARTAARRFRPRPFVYVPIATAAAVLALVAISWWSAVHPSPGL